MGYCTCTKLAGSKWHSAGTDIINMLLDAGPNRCQKTTEAVEGLAIAGKNGVKHFIRLVPARRCKNCPEIRNSLMLRRGASLDDCWGDRSAEDCLRHIEEPDAFP